MRASFSELLGNLQPGETTLELDQPCYEFSDFELVIDSPLTVKSAVKSKIICKNIQIRSYNVTLDGLHICGGIYIRDVEENVNIQNCSIRKGDMSSGGAIILTRACGVMIENVDIDSIERVPGIFVETNSIVGIQNSRITNTPFGFIVISYQCVSVIQNCSFSNCDRAGVTVAMSTMNISNTKISSIGCQAIAASTAYVNVKACDIRDCKQVGIILSNCHRSSVSDCTLDNIESSAVFATNSSTGCKVVNNKMTNINGNGVYVNDHSDVEITGNEMTELLYPGVAVLHSSTAVIAQNKMNNLKKTGICARGAVTVHIKDNELTDIAECGFSVSETEQCVINNNKITRCAAGGCESYNMSETTIENNKFDDVGQYAFISFTGGKINARNNVVSKASEAMVWLTTGGNGSFIDNIVTDCPVQYVGSTSGWFAMKNNGDFENMSNDEALADTLDVPFVDRRDIPTKGICWRCKKNPIQGFCVTCGHKVYCNDCGKAVVEEQDKVCPLCRFPITAFTDGFNLGEECEICLERKPDSIVLPCGHIQYCKECLEVWIRDNGTCPTCRTADVTYKALLPDF